MVRATHQYRRSICSNAVQARTRSRWVTPILGLCHWNVFTDWFIFRYILESQFFPQKMESPLRLWAHSKNKKYQKGKLNVIKRWKISFFWSVGFANWIVGPERCSKFAPKLVGENAVTTLLAPGYELPPGSFFFFFFTLHHNCLSCCVPTQNCLKSLCLLIILPWGQQE